LFAVAVTAGGCGAETWSFDHNAGAENLDAAMIQEVGNGDAAAREDEDAELGDRSEPEDDARIDVAPLPDVTTPCSVDSDCSGATPHCNQSAGICGRCQVDVDCASDAGPRVCNTATGACVECLSSADCSIGTLRPYCDTAADRCVQCLSNTNCGFESFCLPTHTCTKMF
jgi:hypothetical protein